MRPIFYFYKENSRHTHCTIDFLYILIYTFAICDFTCHSLFGIKTLHKKIILFFLMTATSKWGFAIMVKLKSFKTKLFVKLFLGEIPDFRIYSYRWNIKKFCCYECYFLVNQICLRYICTKDSQFVRTKFSTLFRLFYRYKDFSYWCFYVRA